ncbi:MAG: arginine--tRNA ligase [Pirellulaceae bacterium]|nr:arginine--tRNA ligase [Pirellulaceae bacterium]
MNILHELRDRFRTTLERLITDPSAELDMIRPAQDARFGDYQANCAMPLGKKLGKPPREVAQQITASLQIDDFCHPAEIAGPGFINLQVQDTWIAEQLHVATEDERLGIKAIPQPKTYVIDFSSPNVAKPMHVGHIRSTVIGDSLCRILRFLGNTVVSDNHLGDWGTQFGMIIYGYRNFANPTAYQQAPVQELGRVYRVVRRLVDYHEAVAQQPVVADRITELETELETAEQQSADDKAAQKKQKKIIKKLKSQLSDTRASLASLAEKLSAAQNDTAFAARIAEHATIGQDVLQETAKLHAGDPDNAKLWEDFLPKCRAEIERVYGRLGVTFDEELGESFYHDRLGTVVDDLVQRGLASESEGATCVFLDGFEAPMIIRKKDGAFLYATTDLATIQYRRERWSPDAILYVVDFRQADHFDKLFAAAKKWGIQDVELKHIEFGTVLGDDGKPFKTRSGDTVGLESLLDAAVEHAAAVVNANDDGKPNGPELSSEQRTQIANIVGHAAIKYADLSQNRASDYVYNEDKMVALRGNTATYLQYSYARVKSIFARGGIDIESLRQSGMRISLEHEKERALGLQILRFSEALEEVSTDYRPNHLTNYLYELATSFSGFFEACPVIKAESTELRDSRALLCDLTARTLQTGLSLLGIQVVEKM